MSGGNGVGGSLGSRLVDPEAVPRHAGVIVVGGGLAGLELAKELERLGRRSVVVLEAGPVADLQHVNAAHDEAVSTTKCFDPKRDEHFHRPYTSDSGRHYTHNSGLRRRLGGRSLYWHGVVLPIEPWALKEPWWPAEVVADLADTWCDGASLYDRVMAQMSAWQQGGVPKYADAMKDVRIGDEWYTLTPNACRVAGDGHWSAYSPLDYWVTGAGRTDPGGAAMFACDTEVVAVDVRNGRAVGVTARRVGSDRVFRVAADAVVLCSAAIENARLVIQALSGTGALAVPRLGGMADHIVQGFVLRLDSSTSRLPDYLRHNASYMAPARPRERSYLRFDVHHPKPGEVVVDVRTTGEQVCRPESYVECLRESDPPWPTVVRTSMCEQDYEVVTGQHAMMREFWSELASDLGARRMPLEFEEFGRQTRTNTVVLREFVDTLPFGEPTTWVSMLGTEDHEGGTLPLGELLDGRHEVVGVSNLYAAGPTTFPRLGAANPSLTCLALSHRLAAVLSG